jgi:hypothetical protein
MANFRIKRKVKLFFGRTWQKFNRTLDPSKRIPELNPVQAKTVSVIRRIIRNPESELIGRDQETGFFYLEHKHYFVRFSSDTAIVTNGKFSYYVSLPEYTCEKLQDYFYTYINERIKRKEVKYDINTLSNFDKILNTLS